jgi:hypothetical protein
LLKWKVMPKVAAMESDSRRDSVREQLSEMERGELVSWVVYPPTPAWWAPFFGLWAAVLTLVIGLLDDVVLALAQLALVSVMFVVIAWDRRRRGTYPSGLPPRAFTAAVLWLVVGAAAVAGLAVLVAVYGSVWVAAVVAGAAAWAIVAWYEREYAAIASRLREQLR